MESVGLELTCNACEKTFQICKACYRGHVYCSDHCSHEGNKRKRKEAQKKYEKTKKGKKARARRQAKHRKKIKITTISLTTSTVETSALSQVIDDSSFKSLLIEKVTHTSSTYRNISVEVSPYHSASPLSRGTICCLCGIKLKKLEKVNEGKRMEE